MLSSRFAGIPISSSTIDGPGVPQLLNRGEQTLRAVTGSGGRLHFGMVAGIKSERWPTSNRNPWPDCLGIRSQASLLTRNRLDWTDKYPQIASALRGLNCRQAYLDGELCAVQEDGTTSFAVLQGHGETPANLVYFAFDLLHLDGDDLSRLPLLDRKAALGALLQDAPADVRLSEHIIGNGARMFEEARKLRLEGIVSKQIGKACTPGNRGIWVKTKFLNREEFIVVGWTDPARSRSSLGSLLLGYYRDDGKLIYAGRAGTGMTERELRTLLKKLRPLAARKMTVDAPPPTTSRFGKPLELARVHWVRPELVIEVTYLTWTDDGLLRHVVYEGLREDKSPRDPRRAS